MAKTARGHLSAITDDYYFIHANCDGLYVNAVSSMDRHVEAFCRAPLTCILLLYRLIYVSYYHHCCCIGFHVFDAKSMTAHEFR